MNKYIASFSSHFGAVSYFKMIKKQGIKAKLMPVPRSISSSCGTCVYYEYPDFISTGEYELECIYSFNTGEPECVFKA